MEELDIRDRANRVHYAIRPRCDQALNLANQGNQCIQDDRYDYSRTLTGLVLWNRTNTRHG